MKTQCTLIFTTVMTAILASDIVWSDVCSNAEVANFYDDAAEENRAWIAYVVAPQKIIGGDVEHWHPHLSQDYQFVDVKGIKSRHWKQPAVSFELQDELTNIYFDVNLVTNQHMLQKVETTSMPLLEALGIPWKELNASNPKVWCVCGDSTCDSFSIRKSDSGDFVGTWTRGWD